jgi:hypothetical protein
MKVITAVLLSVIIVVMLGYVYSVEAQTPQNLKTNPKNVSFNYVLYGKPDTINLTLYEGAYTYFFDRDTHIYIGLENETYTEIINNKVQAEYLQELVTKIKSKSNNTEDQARIAINLVQKMDYEDDNDNEMLYPYEILYQKGGVCAGKSGLLAYLLKEIGYDTSFLVFRDANHMAVGIKTDSAYAYKNTGYAFIETTKPNIITYSYGSYPNPLYVDKTLDQLLNHTLDDSENRSIKLTSDPEIYHVSSGMSFKNLSRDDSDAQKLSKWQNTKVSYTTLKPTEYRQWETILWYYGLSKYSWYYDVNPETKPMCENNETFCNDACWDKCQNNTLSVCENGTVYCKPPILVGESYENLKVFSLLFGMLCAVLGIAIFVYRR